MDKKKARFHIWYIILAMWGIMLLQGVISEQYAPKVLMYSEFLNALEADRIIDVAVTANNISGKMRDEKGGEVRFTTVRVGPDLAAKLSKHNVAFKGKIESTFVRDLLSWIVPTALFFGVWWYLMKKMRPGADMMSFGRNKAKIYAETEVKTTFEEVAGEDEAKEELAETVEFLKTPERFERLGGRMPKGVLLVGPPGTGKTLLARAVAGEAGAPFFSISGSEFVEMFVGMGAARVRDLFKQAREKAPCIIFIDELDAIGKSRAGAVIGGHDEREQTLNQLLVEMDGFDPRIGVVIMAATNRPEILDPALLRAGRFDRHVLVDKPDVNGRAAILAIHAKNVQLAPDVDLLIIAQKTPGFSGADLANAVNEAALLAARRNKDAVDMDDLDEAVDRIIGGLEKKNRVINPKEKKIVAHHETGHALIAALTPNGDPVHKISIIPRGLAALGYTQQRPTEDRYLMSTGELKAKIDVLLGGRVAEQIVFGEVTTGAHNDLQRATDIARAMVAEYGMGDTLGLSTYPRQHQPMFISPDQAGAGGREYSEATAAKLDQEVKHLLGKSRDRVEQLLTKYRPTLDLIAGELLNTEVLDQDRFNELIRQAGQFDPDNPPQEA